MARRAATGTCPCTATARAPSTSPPAGPAEVAPTSTPRSVSSMILMSPSLPALWIQPRADDGTCVMPVRTVRPCSRACASVSPTEPLSGSVKVTRGTARYSAAGPSWPRISATAMPAWYMATWVNAPLPVTSPIAHTPSAARIRSSTAVALAVSSSPAAATPSPARSVRRPVATSSRCAVSVSPPASFTVKSRPSWLTRPARAPVRTRKTRAPSAVSTVTTPGGRDPRAATGEVPALAGEPVHGHLVVPGVGRLVPDPGCDRRPVRGDPGGTGHARDPPRLGQQAGRPDHHLRRNAAPVRALPAHQPGLDPCHVQARLRQPARRVLPAGPHPDHHHVRLFIHGRC